MAGLSEVVHSQMDAQIAAALSVLPAAAFKSQLDQLEALVYKLHYLLTDPNLKRPLWLRWTS